MAAKEIGEKQIFGITVGIFAVALVVVGVLIFLSYRRFSKLNRDAADYEARRKSAQLIAETLENKKEERKETQDRVDECNQYLPNDDDIERTLVSLSGKCIDAGLDSNTLKIENAPSTAGRGKAKAAYETIRYKADFEGSFHALAKFVSAVENWKTFKRFVSITTFSVKAASDGKVFDDGNQKHSIKMTLELYKYPEPAPAPTTGKAGGKPVAAAR